MNIYLQKTIKQDKRMWPLNCIKRVSVGGSYTDVLLLSMPGADGALLFCKTY